MIDKNEEIQKLLRLKRYENPPEGFFDDFLKEFQSRQRSELMRRSARSLLLERVSTYISGFGSPRWIGATAGACAAAVIALIMMRGNVADPGVQDPAVNFAKANATSADQIARMRSRYESVTPSSLLFIDDLHPIQSNPLFNHQIVEVESPLDIDLLRNPTLDPRLRPGLTLDF